MSEPTAAAMRAAHSVIGRDAFHYFKVLATGVDAAKAIDNATGLPELIAAASDVCAWLSDLLTNDPSAYGNKYFAPSPDDSELLFEAHQSLVSALRIAREGRS